jgi:anthranilate synthase component 2
LLDHYDSFTHNLSHLLQSARFEVEVIRCDQVTIEEVIKRGYAGIVLSPGPGRPGDRGITLPLIRALYGKLPFFGVCLGLQAMALAQGARIVQTPKVVHGKTSAVYHDERGLFEGIASPFSAMRYHSWVVDSQSLPTNLEPSAWLKDGTIMALRDGNTGDEGVQFHPESFLTQHGLSIIRNLRMKQSRHEEPR